MLIPNKFNGYLAGRRTYFYDGDGSDGGPGIGGMDGAMGGLSGDMSGGFGDFGGDPAGDPEGPGPSVAAMGNPSTPGEVSAAIAAASAEAGSGSGGGIGSISSPVAAAISAAIGMALGIGPIGGMSVANALGNAMGLGGMTGLANAVAGALGGIGSGSGSGVGSLGADGAFGGGGSDTGVDYGVGSLTSGGASGGAGSTSSGGISTVAPAQTPIPRYTMTREALPIDPNRRPGGPEQLYFKDTYTKLAAGGGISGLKSNEYKAGGRYLAGPGDGMSDNIKANIDGVQEARLADGEFVIPADVVSHIGNGSSNAGAKKLHAMMDRIRKARTGNPKQGKQIKAEKFLPA